MFGFSNNNNDQMRYETLKYYYNSHLFGVSWAFDGAQVLIEII